VGSSRGGNANTRNLLIVDRGEDASINHQQLPRPVEVAKTLSYGLAEPLDPETKE
jgi:hypothetical protein